MFSVSLVINVSQFRFCNDFLGGSGKTIQVNIKVTHHPHIRSFGLRALLNVERCAMINCTKWHSDTVTFPVCLTPCLFPCSGSRSSKTFKPKKNIPEGSHQYELLKHAEATLGSGNLRQAVMLPEGEDLNEWIAVNSKWMNTIH